MSDRMKLKGILAFCLLFLSSFVLAEVNQKEFSMQNSPHLPSRDTIYFEDGRDYFSYKEPIEQVSRADKKKSAFNSFLIMIVECVLQRRIF